MSLPLPEQSSRNRSASTGDSGLPQHEHKRPRLSGSQEYFQTPLPLSTVDGDNPPRSRQSASSPSPKHSTPALASPPKTPLPTSTISDATSPTSKVTINTRPISSQASNITTQSDKSHATMEQPDATQTTDSLPHASTSVRQESHHDTISISSDECGSPVIQVAAPEDQDQDPADTQWEPISESALPRRVHIRLDHVQRTFPYNDPPNKSQTYSVITQIGKALTEGHSGDDEIFRNIKQWLVEFSLNADSLDHDFLEQDHDFWMKLPAMCLGLLKRRVAPPKGSQIQDVVEFLAAYLRITTLLVDADAKELCARADAISAKYFVSPYCPAYLAQLQYVITASGIPLYDVLHERLGYSPKVVIGMIIDELQDSYAIKHLQNLHSLFQALADLFPKRTNYFELGLNILTYAGQFVKFLTGRSSTENLELTKSSNLPILRLATLSKEFLRSVDGILDRAISKQQPWFNIEICEKFFNAVTPTVGTLAATFPQLANDLLLNAHVAPSVFDGEDIASLTSTAWKFCALQKVIKKGRMEVRVTCVQIMATDLVEVYNDHIRAAPKEAEHASVQFMIQLLRKNDIIRYIIGVESHPQIVERSANIIGFLCVSRSFCNDDTDIIWHTILESQDPRTVVVLLRVFQQNLENLDIDILCYITRKLLELPYGRFDVNMLEFSIMLINILTAKIVRLALSTSDEADVDECTIRLCLKMLRDANTPEQICTEFSSRIRNQVLSTLTAKVKIMKGHLKLGDGTDLMHAIFVELCNDIRAHNKFASGSSISLGTMLYEATFEECSRVVEEHDIVSLFIDDIAHICENIVLSDFRESLWLEVDTRISLMITLVTRTSHAITDSHLQTLWTRLLAASDLEQHFRQMAWAALATIFERSRLRNNTLDRIVQDYLPILSPALYDKAVLNFAMQSVKYEMFHTPADLIEPKDIVALPGIERIWNIMLKAPLDKVETEASQFIIEQYLDGDLILRRDSDSVRHTHLALIDRTVQQVIDAANLLKPTEDVAMSNNTSIPPSDTNLLDTNQHAIKFHRCLLFLRSFLDNMKMRPRYTPAVNDSLKTILGTFDEKGKPFEVTLQIIGHKTLANIQCKWTVGHDNTGAEVWQFLSDITGWSQFTIINGGRKLVLKEEPKSLGELGIRTGSFMINKVQGSPETTPAKPIRASSPVDNKVMHHFDELYNLLELENQYAKEVFDFLRMFSSQDEIVERLRSMTISPNELLPVEKPFKLMYYARALRSCIEDESFSAEPNTTFLVYGVKTILSVLPDMGKIQAELNTCIEIAQGLVEALILGLRAKVPAEISMSYISDGSTFTENMLALWTRALEVTEAGSVVPTSGALVRAPFEALIEALLHDERIWSVLPEADFAYCLQKALLSHPVTDVRQATLDVIHGLTGVMNPKFAAKNNESRVPRNRHTAVKIETCLGHLWKILLPMMQQAGENSSTCEEYFDAIISTLRQYRQKLNQTDLKQYVYTWRSLLVAHKHNQGVGMSPSDFFISSLGKLLLSATRAIVPSQPISDNKAFVHDLFVSFLFPPVTGPAVEDTGDDTSQLQPRDPILDMNTRGVLYDIILAQGHNKDILDTICDELTSDLVPQDSYFSPTVNNDRQVLRSEAGYSGIRNLSNTCYLNSLVSQLFMNVEFRELVMSVNIIDHSKQKLVAELGKVFAQMQMSYEEAVNPETAIDAITLWDGEQIDVTIQMDVDEFFNLLFDRLESQIVDPKVCTAFKGIYGGQIVQQIKSQECEHVSERLEPFAAVQVEIKGKATLEESLRAYVEGEVLQGENKYSCTGCGKHVNAVKRACLKTIPDHLIFNLKRFDYDIMTGMRCKVNDEFGFPDVIDMAPYTLEALTEPEQPSSRDNFELVGIIIHSGTAESGHYYSYIRQRPSTVSKERSWLQFNDHDVTQFDPASIKECCFGGIDFGAIQCPKFYNGYMLFYQRAASIKTFESKYLDANLNGPVHVPLASDMNEYLVQHNDTYLRTYVAQDPSHARFIRSLLQQKQLTPELDCAQKHSDTTSRLISVALNYVHQLSARWKDAPEVEETLALIQTLAGGCVDCARQVIAWLSKDDNLLTNLVRSCYVNVRRQFVHLIATCWKSWSETIPENEQLGTDVNFEADSQEYLTFLAQFLAVMATGWDFLQRHARSWDHYMHVVTFILRLGRREAQTVIEAGFLELTLELVHVHVPSLSMPKRLRLKYATYLSLRERNRPFAHGSLIQLLADLIESVDLVTSVTDSDGRVVFNGQVGITMAESLLLGIAGQTQYFAWLKKSISGRSNPQAICTIIATLCKKKQLIGYLGNTLTDCLGDRSFQCATACLQPTIVFVSCCSDREVIVDVAKEAFGLIEASNGHCSKEFLDFVNEFLHASNPAASISQVWLKQLVKKFMTCWAPTLLMAPNDIHADVRTDALELVNEILFQDLEDLRTGDLRQYKQDVGYCRSLASACADYAEASFVTVRSPTIQAGQVNQASYVVENCLRFFSDNANDEEQAARMNGIMEDARARAEGVVETMAEADWNASSDLEAMSEVDNLSDTSN